MLQLVARGSPLPSNECVGGFEAQGWDLSDFLTVTRLLPVGAVAGKATIRSSMCQVEVLPGGGH